MYLYDKWPSKRCHFFVFLSNKMNPNLHNPFLFRIFAVKLQAIRETRLHPLPITTKNKVS